MIVLQICVAGTDGRIYQLMAGKIPVIQQIQAGKIQVGTLVLGFVLVN